MVRGCSLICVVKSHLDQVIIELGLVVAEVETLVAVLVLHANLLAHSVAPFATIVAPARAQLVVPPWVAVVAHGVAARTCTRGHTLIMVTQRTYQTKLMTTRIYCAIAQKIDEDTVTSLLQLLNQTHNC